MPMVNWKQIRDNNVRIFQGYRFLGVTQPVNFKSLCLVDCNTEIHDKMHS